MFFMFLIHQKTKQPNNYNPIFPWEKSIISVNFPIPPILAASAPSVIFDSFVEAIVVFLSKELAQLLGLQLLRDITQGFSQGILVVRTEGQGCGELVTLPGWEGGPQENQLLCRMKYRGYHVKQPNKKLEKPCITKGQYLSISILGLIFSCNKVLMVDPEITPCIGLK